MNEPMQMSPNGDSNYEHEDRWWRLFYSICSWVGFIFLLPFIIGSMKMRLPDRGQAKRQVHR